MEKIGMIVEYNPLHNGHLYHYNKIKEMFPNCLTVAILSSEYTQRGELTVFNKFTRTNHALEMGIDLVLSNPIIYSMNDASTFAYSNIFYLNLCGVTKIVAGSESANNNLLKKMHEVENTKDFSIKLKENLKSGYSFKLSYIKAFESFKIKFKSNDLLNYFYYISIQKINKNIELVLIKRKNSNYLDTVTNSSNLQSASTLRKEKIIDKYVPKFVNESFLNTGYRSINNLINIIKFSSLNKRNNIKEMSEGIENRLKNILNAASYEEIINILSCKRYSYSKINRFIINYMLEIKNKSLKIDKYIRVLGFNNNGKKLLNSIKKDIKIYTSIKEGINYEFDLEIKNDKLLDIIYNENLLQKEISSPIIK